MDCDKHKHFHSYNRRQHGNCSHIPRSTPDILRCNSDPLRGRLLPRLRIPLTSTTARRYRGADAIAATADSGYIFFSWSATTTSWRNKLSSTTSASTTLEVTGSGIITATFRSDTVTSVSCIPSSLQDGSSSTCSRNCDWKLADGIDYDGPPVRRLTLHFSGPPCVLAGGTCQVTITGNVVAAIRVDFGILSWRWNNAPSSGSTTVAITKASTSVSVSCTGTTCTATVSGASPTGTITWSPRPTASSRSRPIPAPSRRVVCSGTVTASSAGSVTLTATGTAATRATLVSSGFNSPLTIGTPTVSISSLSLNCSGHHLPLHSDGYGLLQQAPWGPVQSAAPEARPFPPLHALFYRAPVFTTVIRNGVSEVRPLRRRTGGDSVNAGSSDTQWVTVTQTTTSTTVSCTSTSFAVGGTSTFLPL